MRSGRDVSRLLDDTGGGEARPGDYRSPKVLGWVAAVLVIDAALVEALRFSALVNSGDAPAVVAAEVIAAVAFLAWIRRAYANLRAFGVKVLRDTPTSASVWFLVPIASWVMPYLVVQDLWKLSDRSDPHGLNESRSYLVLAWWLLWIGPGLAVLTVIFVRPTFQVGQEGIAILVNVLIATRILAAVLAAAVIVSINSRQEASHRAQLAPGQDGDSQDQDGGL